MSGIKPDQIVMQAVIREAESNQAPFGAALAMGDQVFVTAAGQPGEMHDPSVHPVMKAIRKLRNQTRKEDLSGFILYSTCQPCSVCMKTAIESGIKFVIYGSGEDEILTFSDHESLRNLEFIKDVSGEIEIHGGFMKNECDDLLDKYL